MPHRRLIAKRYWRLPTHRGENIMDYRRKLSFLAVMLLYTLLAAAISPAMPSLASTNVALRSSIKDRVRLELTVYNDNFAFIREVREVTIKKRAWEAGVYRNTGDNPA